MSQDERRERALHCVIPEVRALKSYTLRAVDAPIKLNQNESPWDLPEDVRRRILAATLDRPWNRYPDFHPSDVLAGLGALHGLPGKSVLLGNGSNELIQAIFAATVEQGQRVALPQPTFTLYAMMVAANQGEVVHVPLCDDLQYDEDAWRRLARASDAHLLLCSPNNPTGSAVRRAFIDELAQTTSRLVIVDEAYVQFGTDECASLVAEHPNLIVLRTFSKALGLAGVRLGYALAQPELAELLSRVKLPYNVGVFGLETAREFLRNPKLADDAAARILAERSRLTAALRALPVETVWEGAANFVLVRLAHDVDPVFAALLDQGVLIRDVSSYPMLERCVRISVGTPEQNDRMLEVLTEALTGAPAPPPGEAR